MFQKNVVNRFLPGLSSSTISQELVLIFAQNYPQVITATVHIFTVLILGEGVNSQIDILAAYYDTIRFRFNHEDDHDSLLFCDGKIRENESVNQYAYWNFSEELLSHSEEPFNKKTDAKMFI